MAMVAVVIFAVLAVVAGCALALLGPDHEYDQ
jgi:hypothetical protein